VTFESAVEEGTYLNDLIFPSSSPVKNRDIVVVWGMNSGRWKLDLRFGRGTFVTALEHRRTNTQLHGRDGNGFEGA
jgi:hypothetical protein